MPLTRSNVQQDPGLQDSLLGLDALASAAAAREAPPTRDTSLDGLHESHVVLEERIEEVYSRVDAGVRDIHQSMSAMHQSEMGVLQTIHNRQERSLDSTDLLQLINHNHQTQMEVIQTVHSRQERTMNLAREANHEARGEIQHAIATGMQNARRTTEQMLTDSFLPAHDRLINEMMEKHGELLQHMKQQHDATLYEMRQAHTDQINLGKMQTAELNHAIGQLTCTVRESLEGMNRSLHNISGVIDRSHGNVVSTLAAIQEEKHAQFHRALTSLLDGFRYNVDQLAKSMDSTVGALAQQVDMLITGMPSTPAKSKYSSQVKIKGNIDTPSKTASVTRQRKLADESDQESESSSESDTSDESDAEDSRKNTGRKGKLHPFHGREKWNVWYKQFKVCTPKMSRSDRLKELLSLMKDEAALFVFDQLPDSTLKDYKELKKQLANRFNKVESVRTYRAKLSKMKQRSESNTDFATEMKWVYDKAYPDRDEKTRREDLLQKYLDAVKDQHAASQVQFVRKLKDIDDAADALNNYQELHGKSERAARLDDSELEEYSEEIKYAGQMNRQGQQFGARSNNRPYQGPGQNGYQNGRQYNPQPHNPMNWNQNRPGFQGQNQYQSSPGNTPYVPRPPMNMGYQGQNQAQRPPFPVQQFNGSGQVPVRPPMTQQQNPTSNQGNAGNMDKPNSEIFCYSCGGPGHIAKFCEAIRNHMQMIQQPGSQPYPTMTSTPTNREVGKLVEVVEVTESSQITNCPASTPEQWSGSPGEYSPQEASALQNAGSEN